MPPIPGTIDGEKVADRRTAILPPAVITWYKKRKLWDKIKNVRIANQGLTMTVLLERAKHTWRYNDTDVMSAGRIRPLRTWDLEVKNI